MTSCCVYVGVCGPEKLTTERAHTALERVFERLNCLGHTREHLKQLHSVYNAGDGTHQVSASVSITISKLVQDNKCTAVSTVFFNLE